MTSSLSPATACALLYTGVFTLYFAVTTLPDAAQARSEREAFAAVVVRVHPASHCMIATDMYVRQRFLQEELQVRPRSLNHIYNLSVRRSLCPFQKKGAWKLLISLLHLIDPTFQIGKPSWRHLLQSYYS